jgi:CelD/BcsL family acetyltransferase involved in cellulose biosynthesis
MTSSQESTDVVGATAFGGVGVEEWDALVDRVGAGPFLRPGWLCAWWRAFGSGELQVLRVRSAGRLRGVLPLARVGRALRSPTNAETPEFGFLAEDEPSARELAEILLRQHALARIDLYPVDPNDAGIRALCEDAAAHQRRVLLRPMLLSPYIATESAWRTYEGSIGAKRRKEIRRRHRRLEERGKVTLEICAGDENLEALLAEGLRLEASGWKAAEGTAINSRIATRRFYHEVAEWSSRRGELRLAFLRLDGRGVAFDFCLEAQGTHYLLKNGYDPEFGQYGPGMILRCMMIERAFAEGLRTYEFLGTSEGDSGRWKLDWTDKLRPRLRLQVFPRSVAGAVECAACQVGPVLMRQMRTGAKRLLGSSGRTALKRARYLLQRALES